MRANLLRRGSERTFAWLALLPKVAG